jgi:phosphoesterase RecJ-like protein
MKTNHPMARLERLSLLKRLKMPVDQAALALAKERFGAAQRILLAAHMRPDGDAVGSLIGLGLALQQSGRQVQMVIEDGVPSEYRLLEGSDQILKRADGQFDLVGLVDCSEMERTGKVLSDWPMPDVNIDHHCTNRDYARVNLIDLQAVATAEIVADLIPALGLKLTQPVAAALLTGLVTDTIGFRTSNVTPKALRLAAELMETGVNLSELYRRTLINRSFEAVRLWGAGLTKVERLGRLVWTTLTRLDRESVHYPGRDDADLINILAAIEDADISIVFVEQSNGSIKVSWRAQPGFDVSKVALSFGGGGHAAASGAEISGSLSEVQAAVLEQTCPLVTH